MLYKKWTARIRVFATLTKPGIITGNIISLTSGCVLGSHANAKWSQICMLALGAALVIASGCVVNNAYDRDIDALMLRTQRRPMVGGDVTVKAASIFAVMLLFLGLFAFYTASRSTVATALLIFGYVIYSGIYTFLLKRNSVYGTLVGSIAGAMPPVAGYCATNGRFDGGALLLVAIFSIWQMPHSYAIAIFRKSDYQAANIPVLPVVNGVESAKRHIVLHMLAFMFFAPALSLLGYAGQLYLAASVLGGAYWLWLGFKGFGTDNDVKWARKVFFTSILLVTTICAAMAIPI